MTKAIPLLLVLMLAHSAVAREIRVPLDADQPTAVQGVTVAVTVDDTPLPQPRPLTFTFNPVPTHVVDRLHISTQGAPATHDNFDLEMDVPFNLGGDTIDLVAPILHTELTIPRQRTLKNMRALAFGTQLSGLIKVNERAVRAMETSIKIVSSGSRPYNTEDGFAVMMFARSAATLATIHFVQPDKAMLDGIAFVEGALADNVTAAKLFPTEKERLDVSEMLVTFSNFRSAQQKRLVDAATESLGNGGPAALAANCPIVLDLGDRIQRSRQNVPLAYEMRNLEDVVICRKHAITWRETPPDDANDRIMAAQQTLDLITERLIEFAVLLGAEPSNSGTYERATRRRIELANQLDFITARMAHDSGVSARAQEPSDPVDAPHS